MGTTNLFRVGAAHIDELKDLVDEGLTVETDELSALLAQIDLLYHYALRLKVDGEPIPYCGVLQHLAEQQALERMVRCGAKPALVRAIRSRRGKTYETCLQKLANVCLPRIHRSVQTARISGEWALWTGAVWRYAQLEWCIFRLRSARRMYLLGIPVDITPILQKVKLLAK